MALEGTKAAKGTESSLRALAFFASLALGSCSLGVRKAWPRALRVLRG